MATYKFTSRLSLLAIGFSLLLTACKKDDLPGDPTSLLSGRPFEPLDKDMYSIYTAMPPANGPAPTEQQAADLLRAYAEKDPWVGTDKALAVFNNPALRGKAPSPAIGAAIAALSGYPGGDAAIDYYTSATTSGGQPKVARIAYGTRPAPGVIIQAEVNGQGQLFYTIDERLTGESPFLLSPLLIHEALHQDNQVGREEETAAMVFQCLFTLLQLKNHPELAALKTELSQNNATWALALFNSGRDGRLGILAANGALFPGSQSSASSLTMLLSPFPTLSSTGNTIMLQYLTGFFQSPVPACATQTFNDNLIQCLDRALGSTSAQGDSYFSPAERIKMGEALRLRM